MDECLTEGGMAMDDVKMMTQAVNTLETRWRNEERGALSHRKHEIGAECELSPRVNGVGE